MPIVIPTILVSMAISVALSVGMRLISSLLNQNANQPQYGGQLPRAQDPGTSLTLRDPAAPQRIVYGTRRVPGTIVFAHCTENNRLLHLVVAWTGHKIHAFGGLYFGDELIPLSAGQATGKFAGFVGCEDQLGGPDQGAFENLVARAPGLWTSAHRGRGISCSYITLHWDRDLFGQFSIDKIWRVVDGKEVYDLRTDTVAFTDNVSLCIADWMNSEKFGRGVPYDEMDEDELIASANVDDEEVTLASGGTEKRYTCNALLTSDTPFIDNLTKLLSANHGECGQVGGLWAIRSARWEEPELTFDESHFREPFTLTNGTGREGFNAAKGSFSNPAKNYQKDDLPAIIVPSYEIEDGGDGAGLGRVFQDANLECTTSASMGQRILRIDLRSARQPLAFTARLKLHGLRAVVGKNVAINFAMLGWEAKPWRVKRMRLVPGFGPDGQPGVIGVDLDLIETAEFIYDWTASDEITSDPAPNTTLPNPFSVLPPSNLTAVETLYATRNGGGVKAKVTLAWDASPDAFVISGGSYVAEYRLSSDSTWTKLPRIDDGATSIDIFDIDPGTYDFRVWAFQWTGSKASSAPTLVSRFIAGLSAAPSAPGNLSVSAIGGVAVLRWDLPSDLDVLQGGFIVVRHSSLTTGATWDTAISIGEALPANAMAAVLPLKAGTYLAKFRDASGVYSATAGSFAQAQSSVHEFITLGSVVEHSAFSGTKTNTVVVDSVLRLDGDGLFDDVTGVDALAAWDWLGGVETSGSYAFASKLDLGSVKRCRLTGIVDSQVTNVFELLDSRSGDADDWPSWDGGMSGDEADARLWVRATQTDPAGSPTWTGWQRLDSAEFEARGFDFRLDLTSEDISFTIAVSALSVVAAEVV